MSDGKKAQLELPRQLMPSAVAKGVAVRAARTAVVVKRIFLIIDCLNE